MAMVGAHDGYLAALSVLIAIFASFTALSLATRMRTSSGWARRVWLVAAAVALGGGIWSMHFVAMLAFSMPGMEISYDLPLTLASLAIALLFTGAGFAVTDWKFIYSARFAVAGLLMGSGVVAMHYIGMAAMRMAATPRYEWQWIAFSIFVAVGASSAAVYLSARDQKLVQRMLAAGVMGVAIAGMHFAGMQAASFAVTSSTDVASGPSLGQTYLAALVSIVTILTLSMGLGAAAVERIFQGYARREARTALRLRIADVLRTDATKDGLQQVAALIGEHFGASRTGYGQLDPVEDVFDYDVCWTDGSVPALLGRLPAAAFGIKIVAVLNAGGTVAIDDLQTSELSNEAETRDTARSVDTRAILVVPFVRDGRLRTIVYLNDRRPRQWHRDDIEFIEEIAERTRLVIERAAAEEQLRALNATLEERVQARTRELHEAQEALLHVQKLEAVGQLVSGMAHDFNNVLAATAGALEIVRRRAHEPESVEKYAAAGLQATKRGARLTSQLLAFARSQRIQLEPLLVCDVIRPLHDLLSRTLGPMIRLDVQLNPHPMPVLADATQVEMTVLNLAINARDAMPDGGTLTISTAVRTITNDHELPDGDYVEITVSDTGTGMDETTLRRAVEPFFTTKPVGKGTGLGLSQIHGSTRQAGGSLRLESKLGTGTTVRVLLPRTDQAPLLAQKTSNRSDARRQHTLNVLLVDDDHDVRPIIATALQELGHQVSQAEDGAKALAILGTTSFDIAVIDFAMPDMNGAELARHIGQRWPRLPILFVSGFADTAAIEAAAGAHAKILRKPFQLEDLRMALDEVISRTSTLSANRWRPDR